MVFGWTGATVFLVEIQCLRLLALVHSFIHYGGLYSAPSRLLLRSAPDPCMAKKKDFEARVVRVVVAISVYLVGDPHVDHIIHFFLVLKMSVL